MQPNMGRGPGPRGGFPPFRPENNPNNHSSNLHNHPQRASFEYVPSIWSSPNVVSEAGDRPSSTSSGSNDWSYSYPNQMVHTRNGTNGSSPKTSVPPGLSYQLGGMNSSMRRPSHDHGFGILEQAGERAGAGAFNIASSGPSESTERHELSLQLFDATQLSHRSSVVPTTSSFSQTWKSNNRGSVGDGGVQTSASWLPQRPLAEIPDTSTERPVFPSNPWNNSSPSVAASARPFTPASPTTWNGESVNGFQAGNGFSNGNGFANGSGFADSVGLPTGNRFQSDNAFHQNSGFTINNFTNFGSGQHSRSSFSQTQSRRDYSTPTNFDRRASSQSFSQQPQPTSNVPIDPVLFQQQLQMYNMATNLGMGAAYPHPSLPTNGLVMGAMGSGSVQNAKLREYLNSRNAPQKWDLKQIQGSIADFAADRTGSRFIQEKLQSASSEEKTFVFQELYDELIPLMTDVYGNYVVQKFFEHGTQEQKTKMALVIKDNMLRLSENKYGCRVVQKALDNIFSNYKVELVSELRGHIDKLNKSQEGNHVIQMIIKLLPRENIGFIYDSFRGPGKVMELALNQYACRVIQRTLEHGNEEDRLYLVSELHKGAHTLITDAYGNYVAQHIIEAGKSEDRARMIATVMSQAVALSTHKHASNVVEKCIKYGTPEDVRRIRDMFFNPQDGVGGYSSEQQSPDSFLRYLMLDHFANYVIHKLVKHSTFVIEEQQFFVDTLEPKINELLKNHKGLDERQRNALKKFQGIINELRKDIEKKEKLAKNGNSTPPSLGPASPSLHITSALPTPDGGSEPNSPLDLGMTPTTNATSSAGSANGDGKQSMDVNVTTVNGKLNTSEAFAQLQIRENNA
ncbi:armadillo-type protein [Sordaria sp. MPI-SDFR-AT-0083]|nr:armadillo-type protein [Sordaria sp. MPI-SDFR-AT-0083]